MLGRLPGARLAIHDVADAGLGYASIAFGACVTGVVLALTLPSVERAARWATSGPKGSEFSHYSDLIFVLTWSAISQLAVIVVSLGGYLFGADLQMHPAHPRASHQVALAACMAVATYALMQLFTVVSTFSQIGHVAINELNRTVVPAEDDN